MEEPENDDARRRAEQEMEDFLRAQEEAEEDPLPPVQDPEPNDFHQDPVNDMDLDHDQEIPYTEPKKPFRLSYTAGSFIAAFGMLYYALRTRQQWYLAIVYLRSNKIASAIFANVFVAGLYSLFGFLTNVFLHGGLRLHEAETLMDLFRWNVTETCLALAIFRDEINVATGIRFLILVLAKSLHWVFEMREAHLRMSQDAILVVNGWPQLCGAHTKLFLGLVLLQWLDILAVMQCTRDILQMGPGVAVLFCFEAAILLVTVLSSILLWLLHVLDDLFHHFHEVSDPGSFMHRWIHSWRGYKATLVFAVELQAQAAKFVFYLAFFAIVFTFKTLPINLLREVYMNFQALKMRLLAFGKYRRLMASMNQFENPTQEELDDAGTTCIICRDDMTVDTTRRLPGCGHLFHQTCLRDWLVQQQTCPTCQRDISSTQAHTNHHQHGHEEHAQEDHPAPKQDNNNEQDEPPEPESEETFRPSPVGSADTNSTNGVPEVSTSAASMPTESRPRFLKPTPPQYPSYADQTSSTIVDDRKPAARSSQTKHVRILDPNETNQTTVPPAFPAFYRVVADEGAAVYNNGQAMSFVIRIVPFGVVILAQDMAWREVDGEGRMMIRMPDGWVCDDTVERIVAKLVNMKPFQAVSLLFFLLSPYTSLADAAESNGLDDPVQVCVILDNYGDGCKGSPKSSNMFTALTEPGSPCKHTDNMKKNSASDQFCDENGVFHQKVYVGDTHCKVPWSHKAFSPMHLTYTQHKCTYGYKLRSCTPGPCEEMLENDGREDAVADVEKMQLRHATS
eukprot:Nitzschia sp. Nitz4//scaffold194_size40385//30857//33466//NITZ4_007532-RA/size40385-processed-gene-0.3-mRNA-1//1//CDS//3329540340//8943//frame0